METDVKQHLELNGHKVDLNKVFPLRARDWKALRKSGITPGRLTQGANDIDAVTGYVLHMLRKASAAISEDEIDDLPMSALLRIMTQMNEYEKSVDPIDPLPSTATTSSGGATDGAPTSSTG